jgi:anti-sigma regulatory factor (Ser/Thr protein kinase)
VSAPDISLELPATPDAVPRAREAIRHVEALLSDDLVRDLRLLTSELVTNSVRHGRLAADAHIVLNVRVTPSSVIVDVTDPGSGFDVQPSRPTQDQQSGWGLYLVDRLAARWGIENREHTRVWFEMSRRPADSAASV